MSIEEAFFPRSRPFAMAEFAIQGFQKGSDLGISGQGSVLSSLIRAQASKSVARIQLEGNQNNQVTTLANSYIGEFKLNHPKLWKKMNKTFMPSKTDPKKPSTVTQAQFYSGEIWRYYEDIVKKRRDAGTPFKSKVVKQGDLKEMDTPSDWWNKARQNPELFFINTMKSLAENVTSAPGVTEALEAAKRTGFQLGFTLPLFERQKKAIDALAVGGALSAAKTPAVQAVGDFAQEQMSSFLTVLDSAMFDQDAFKEAADKALQQSAAMFRSPQGPPPAGTFRKRGVRGPGSGAGGPFIAEPTGAGTLGPLPAPPSAPIPPGGFQGAEPTASLPFGGFLPAESPAQGPEFVPPPPAPFLQQRPEAEGPPGAFAPTPPSGEQFKPIPERPEGPPGEFIPTPTVDVVQRRREGQQLAGQLVWTGRMTLDQAVRILKQQFPGNNKEIEAWAKSMKRQLETREQYPNSILGKDFGG